MDGSENRLDDNPWWVQGKKCVLSDIRWHVFLSPLCCVILLAWNAQEVRAESATQIESQIQLSTWLDISLNPVPGVFRVDGVKLASSVESQPDTSHDSVFKAASNDLTKISQAATTPEFWQSALQIAGITLVSAIADKPLDKFAFNHGNSGLMPSVERLGNNLSFVAIAYSATMYLTSDEDSKMARSSYSSLAAGGVGALSALGLKYLVGRARPTAGEGPASFNPISAGNGDTSWPSIHTTVMWAVITPYAKAYDAPWLYGVAAVTNVARVGGRDHWFSDTAAGSLLGYAIGNFMWESHQTEKGAAQWMISPNKVAVNWRFD